MATMYQVRVWEAGWVDVCVCVGGGGYTWGGRVGGSISGWVGG